MAGRALFINVGFDPTATLEVISALSLSSGDLLSIVYPKSEDSSARLRSEQARAQIRSHLEALRARGRNIRYKEVELNLQDINRCIESLIMEFEEVSREGFRIYLELTGGVRIITVLMVLISSWMPSLVEEVTLIGEVTRERIRLPVISPALFSDNVLRKVLALISSRGSVKRRELRDELSISESSVSRAVTRLKRMGLIKEELRVLSLHDRFRPISSFFRVLNPHRSLR